MLRPLKYERFNNSVTKTVQLYDFLLGKCVNSRWHLIKMTRCRNMRAIKHAQAEKRPAIHFRSVKQLFILWESKRCDILMESLPKICETKLLISILVDAGNDFSITSINSNLVTKLVELLRIKSSTSDQPVITSIRC